MGCAASSIDKDERVQICRDRKMLMKQLVRLRAEFADAQFGYLRALRDTGATLRQFSESENLELENVSDGFAMPPSPPPPLPPAPPPPPFSPDLRKVGGSVKEEAEQDGIVTDDEESGNPPIPPFVGSSWDFLDPFQSLSPHHQKRTEKMGPAEVENWEETKSEFEGEDQEGEASGNVINSIIEKPRLGEIGDDSSSTKSSHAKEIETAMTLLKRKKKLEDIIKELDEYFLAASSSIKEIAVLMGISNADGFPSQNSREIKSKRGDSSKVFNAKSWSWSFKSLQSAADVVEFCGPDEPCRPGAHCITLKKLYDAEQRLYKEVKEEEAAKLEHARKSLLLQKQEDENHDWSKLEKTRSSVESLEADKIRLQQSISSISSSILMLIDEELFPQLVALTSGLMHMWRTMSECHQHQKDISRQLNYIAEISNIDLSRDYHRQATIQLETEVTAWYNCFCNLVKYQREYVRTLYKWTQLTDSLKDDDQRSVYLSVVRSLCEKWQLSLDKLPDKAASGAIKSLLSAIQSILQQQVEEHNLLKKYEKSEKRMQKELDSLSAMERKLERSSSGEENSNLSPKNPLSVKRAKTETLKKQVETEKLKYLSSVQVSKAMVLKHLKTCLPNLFQALFEFSGAFVHAIEDACNPVAPEGGCDGSLSNTTN